MILSDLLDRPVHDADGHHLGYVIDARFVLDGPLDGLLARPRLHGLLVSPHSRTPFLGFERTDARSPWPIAQMLRRWHRGTFLVHWADVAAHSSQAVTLSPTYRRWSPELSVR